MENLIFITSLLCASTILLLGILDLLQKNFTFWPPPQKGSWQDKAFIWLFRGMLYSLIALSVLKFKIADIPALQIALGSILLIGGFGAAIASTLNLGWDNAFGDRQGLVTNGWFAWSRNPVYVVTWIGMIGWAILIPAAKVWIILILWALIYLVAVILEERWLEGVYGDEFNRYRAKVRRFL